MLDTTVSQRAKDKPGDLTRVGFGAMLRGDGDVLSGWKDKLQFAVANMPTGILAEQHRRMAEPGSAENAND